MNDETVTITLFFDVWYNCPACGQETAVTLSDTAVSCPVTANCPACQWTKEYPGHYEFLQFAWLQLGDLVGEWLREN